MKKKIKIALVAPYPAQLILDSRFIKQNHLNRPVHPAPWVRSLTTAYAKRDDIEFRVFSHSRAVSKVCYGEENGVPYTFIPKYEPARLGCYHLHIPARIQFRKHIRQYAPDLIHGFGTESTYGLIAVEQGLPNVVFIQGIVSEYAPYVDHRSMMQKKVSAFLERLVVKKVTGFVAETQFAEKWAKSMRNDVSVAVIPHAVNQEFFNVSPSYASKEILVVGGIDSRKAVDVSIRALAKSTDKECKLCIIGAGPLLEEMKQLSIKLNVFNQIEFCGYMNRSQIIEKMSAARILTILSRMDTSPNILTEAHAAGLPVIGTRAGGIPDMIDDGVDGFLVDVDDAEAVAEKMDLLIDDFNRCKAMGRAGREKVRWLNDPGRIAGEHIKFYHEVLGW